MLRIFLTDLAAYNSGYLIGEWITLPLEAEELEKSIQKILYQGEEVCKDGIHEECFITDDEFEDISFFKVEEFDSPYLLNERISFIEENIEPHQYNIIKFLLDNDLATSLEDAITKVDDVIVHSDCSMSDIAEAYVEEIIETDNLPPLIAGHIDYNGIGRDLEIDGTYIKVNFHIFEFVG